MGKGNSKLKAEVVADLLQMTDFTEQEIIDWHERFLKDCPSGYLSLEDFKKTYVDMFPDGDDGQFAENFFGRFDSNRDGNIDFGEFMCALSVNSKESVETQLKLPFKV